MRAAVLILVALLGVASAIPDSDAGYAADHIIVKHKSGLAITQSAQATHGVRHQRKLHSKMNLHLYKVADGSSVEDKVAELNKRSDVMYAEPNYAVRQARAPNDPEYKRQWHHAAIKSPEAWDIITDAKLPGVKVCHIDGGAQPDHPDLQGSILDGWNFAPRSGNMSDYPVDRNSPEFKDYSDAGSGHGTFSAGLIAATGNNGIDTAGVAWSANLLVCKFWWPNGFAYLGDAVQCLDLCAEAGAFVSSNSWDIPYYCHSLVDIINASNEAGMLFVAAAGNAHFDADTSDQYPAHFFMDSSMNLDNLITVAAVGPTNELSLFEGWGSNYGKKTVTIAAPGENMWSLGTMSNYVWSQGTSTSTPLVTGVLALMKAYALSHGVDATAAQLKAALIEGGTAVPGLKDVLQTGKVLDAEGALLALIKNLNLGGPIPPAPPTLSPPPPSPVSSPPPSPVSSPPPNPPTVLSPPEASPETSPEAPVYYNSALYAWGSNASGALARATNVGGNELSPVLVTVNALSPLVGGSDFACAVYYGVTFVCWGSNSVGQLGQGAAVVNTYSAWPLTVMEAPTAWDVGSAHVCVVPVDTSKGTALCWGENSSGQLGVSTTANSSTPRPVVKSNTISFAKISTGGSHTCSVTQSYALYCWGSNERGQLGIGTTGGMATVPGLVGDPEQEPSAEWGVVLASERNTCATTSTHAVYCWGAGDLGANGSGGTDDYNKANLVGVYEQAAYFRGSGNTIFLVMADGSADCWGDNSLGQLGIPAAGKSQLAPRSCFAQDVQDIVAQPSYTCSSIATQGTATLSCAGSNGYGQLGIGSTEAQPVPVAVAAPCPQCTWQQLGGGARAMYAYLFAGGEASPTPPGPE